MSRRYEYVGSIPAHAGEPAVAEKVVAVATVYPRPRGGTESPAALRCGGQGLSPPTRGNLTDNQRGRLDARSIPAHAGEPARVGGAGVPVAVYPRPRGGTSGIFREAAYLAGLSPPTRGNLRVYQAKGSNQRSIPAHAGEPGSAAASRRLEPVYPRPRGGTSRTTLSICSSHGLSPPTRGNPA